MAYADRHTPQTPVPVLIYDALIARHLRHPRGFLGRRVARQMNAANLPLYELALDQLALGPTDRTLDLGFGGGPGFALMAARTPGGVVYGIDSSTTMLKQAERRHVNLIAAQRLIVLRGDFADIPIADAQIDAIVTVNTIYFWADPTPPLAEAMRVLAPGGRLAIAFRLPAVEQRKKFERIGFLYRAPDIVADLMVAARFSAATIAQGKGRTVPFFCISAAKPA